MKVVLCDSCHAVMYPSEYRQCALRIGVRSRYGDGNPEFREFDLDLCKKCDLNVANALLPVLPQVAYAIEPNACHTPPEAP